MKGRKQFSAIAHLSKPCQLLPARSLPSCVAELTAFQVCCAGEPSQCLCGNCQHSAVTCPWVDANPPWHCHLPLLPLPLRLPRVWRLSQVQVHLMHLLACPAAAVWDICMANMKLNAALALPQAPGTEVDFVLSSVNWGFTAWGLQHYVLIDAIQIFARKNEVCFCDDAEVAWRPEAMDFSETYPHLFHSRIGIHLQLPFLSAF